MLDYIVDSGARSVSAPQSTACHGALVLPHSGSIGNTISNGINAQTQEIDIAEITPRRPSRKAKTKALQLLRTRGDNIMESNGTFQGVSYPQQTRNDGMDTNLDIPTRPSSRRRTGSTTKTKIESSTRSKTRKGDRPADKRNNSTTRSNAKTSKNKNKTSNNNSNSKRTSKSNGKDNPHWNVRMGEVSGMEYVVDKFKVDTILANKIVFEMASDAQFSSNYNRSGRGKKKIKKCDKDKVCCLCDKKRVPADYTGSTPWTYVGKDTQRGKLDVHTFCMNRAYNFKRKVLSHNEKLCKKFKQIWIQRVREI